MFYPTLPLSLSSIRVVKITQLHSEEWFILMRKQGREFMFLTNNFELPASVIAELYHNRWNIELFLNG